MRGLDPLLATPLVIVAGKGGVGKTTVTAALARAAGSSGRRVLAIELDGKPQLAEAAGGCDVRHIAAGAALEEYLLDHGLRRVARRLTSTGVIDVVATAAPGIDDLVVLGKIKQLERSGEWDVIIVDGPAAGHAVTFLTSAAGLRDSVRGGPIGSQADDVLAMLGDPTRTQVVMVAVPETTPVNELLETSHTVETTVGVRIGSWIVNQIDDCPSLPDPATVTFGATKAARSADETAAAVAAAEFRRSRRAAQHRELARVVAHATCAVFALPTRMRDDASDADIEALAAHLREIEPVGDG